MKNKILLGAGLSVCALAWAAKEPVIMTVNGVDVPKSEFEYLYHKNSMQQLAPQSLQDYVELFKIYKLKVADAIAEKIDTTASFRKEMAQYRKELASPYLADTIFFNSLVAESLKRGEEEVEVSHIMIAKSRSLEENVRLKNTLDSIRTVLIEGGNFQELALKYSQDRSVGKNHGYLGWITANKYPYLFEIAAYSTPEGEISEIVELPGSYHIIKTGKHRPSQGKVHASHIMKMARPDASESDKKLAKAKIDSIYEIVKNDPSKFAEIAKKESDDKGSALKGGELPWFGTGDMVPQFENMAFTLKDGEISQPIQTMYGWHIIYKTGSKKSDSFEEMKEELQKRVGNPLDGRYSLIRDNQISRLSTLHKARIDNSGVEMLKNNVSTQGIDSTFLASCKHQPLSSITLAVIDGKNHTIGEYAETISTLNVPDPTTAADILKQSIESWFLNKLTEAEEDKLYNENADFRNLLNEYHDGSLLYEISLKKVWDKASKDQKGLEDYFQKHRNDYRWNNPHVKGILVQTTNDSVSSLVRARMEGLQKDSIIPVIRKEFKGTAQIDKILVEQGANPMVDYLVFGGPKVKASGPKYSDFFIYDTKMLTSPEEMSDVRAQVISDFQNELEAIWIDELKSKYPVKVNEKELKKVK